MAKSINGNDVKVVGHHPPDAEGDNIDDGGIECGKDVEVEAATILVHDEASWEDILTGSNGRVSFLLQVCIFNFICFVLAMGSSLVHCIMPRLKLFNLLHLGGDFLLRIAWFFFPLKFWLSLECYKTCILPYFVVKYILVVTASL